MFGEEKSDDMGSQNFEVMPNGKYNVMLDNVTLDETGNHPMINATFKVTYGKYKNRLLWKRFYFTDATAKKFLPWQLNVMGIKNIIEDANCTSHEESARVALTAMGDILTQGFIVDVKKEVNSVSGKEYNDLIVVKLMNDIDPSLEDEPKNHAPQAATKGVDLNEELPF